MARQANRLKALNVQRIKAPGMYPDGNGLYLNVSASGGKSWVYRFKMNGKTISRDMGLGAFPTVSLEAARQLAEEQRRVKARGIDPIEHRKAEKAKEAAASAQAVTFKEAGEAHIKAHSSIWKNPKHKQQWENTLITYAYPVMGHVPVHRVDTDYVLKVLEPIWNRLPETAARLRGRIESILDRCKSLGQRTGENPARWRGHLSHILPSHRKKKRVKHHKALPYSQIAAFVKNLREHETATAARALELLILTAARTNEVIGARWNEFDLNKKLWVVPGERMKMGKQHRIPLCDRAVTIIKSMHNQRLDDKPDGYVFPGMKKGRPLSNMAMLNLLKRMEVPVTVHGFRSSFKDWASETTDYANEVSEMALAHSIPDEAEEAYRRGDLLEKRVELMADWQKYCEARP